VAAAKVAKVASLAVVQASPAMDKAGRGPKVKSI
jgi:hypothetical protein